MPTVMAEANDINKGVGGARSSDRPVIIPNFNFGGGKKGTMVANTGEHIVPNYGGGSGSAIFNRDMVGRMGLPSNAQKINSAGGFVPNFVDNDEKKYQEYLRILRPQNLGILEKAAEGIGSRDQDPLRKKAAQDLLAEKQKRTSRSFDAEKAKVTMLVPQQGSTGSINHTFKEPYKGFTSFLGTVHGISKDLKNDSEFGKIMNIDQILEDSLVGAANTAFSLVKPLSMKDEPRIDGKKLKELLSAEGAQGAFGSMKGAFFEAILDEVAGGRSNEKNNTLDVAFNSRNRIALEPIFGLEKGKYQYADYKNSIGQKDKFVRQAIDNLGSDKFVADTPKKNAASGYIPNFANYVYDSDKLPAELRASILPAILASKKRKDGILAPAGAGKSTMASGIGQFIQSMEDVAKATGFTILSAAGLAKTPTGISKQFQPILDSIKRSGGSLKYLNVDNEEIKRRREARVATGGNDLRSEAQLKGTSYAPLNQPEFLDILKKEMGGNLQIVNGASGYVPNFVNESYITDTLKRIKDGTSGFSKQEQEMFLKKFGASAKVGNKGISLRKVFDTLDSENGISAMVDKAYRAAGPTASMDQVFQVFSKQIAANPEGLRNLVKQKGFVPNFADFSNLSYEKPEDYAQNQRKRSYKAKTYRNASGIIGDLFKSLPEKFLLDGILGDEITTGMETDGIFNTIKNSAMYASSFAGPNAMKFVSQAEKYGLKVSKGLQNKLAQLVVKGASKIKGYAGGYMPNFADPLKEAISREVGAGVDPSQVYVDQNSSLKNSGNPMGLMVANRRDEPQGGWQGIARARKEGANAKMYGAAGGFVPNYADSNLTPYIGMTRSKALEEADKQYAQALKKQIAAIDADIKATESKLQKVKVNGDAYKKHTDTLAKLNLASNNLSSDMQKENELVKKAITESTKGVLGTGRTATLREARVSEPKEKGSKDMLGTVFALQAGFSALSGATSDATSTVGKYSNIVSEGLSSGTTAVFALQGLGTALPKFAGFLGPAGLAVGALTAAWQIGTKIYNEQTGINRTVAESLDRVGKAAAEASTNLDKLSPEGKKKVEEQSKASVQESLKTGRMTVESQLGTGSVGYNSLRSVEEVARFAQDVTGELKDSLFKMQKEALATGVSVDKLNTEIQKFSKDSIITQDEILQLSSSFKGFIDDLKKVDIEIQKLNLNPNEGTGKIIGQMNPQDVEKFINPSLMSNEEKAKVAGYGNFEDYKKNKYAFTETAKKEEADNPLNILKGALISGGMAEDSEALKTKLLNEANKLIEAYRQKQNAILTDSQALNIEYQKYLAQIKSEASLRDVNLKIEKEISGEQGAKVAAQQALLNVAKDLSLSDEDRKNKNEDINRGLESQLKRLQEQKNAAQKLQDALKKAFENNPTLSASAKSDKILEIFNKVQNLTKDVSQEIGNALNEGDTTLLSKSFSGADDATLASLSEYFKTTSEINSQLELSIDAEGRLAIKIRQTGKAQDDTTKSLQQRASEIQRQIELSDKLNSLSVQSQGPQELGLRKELNSLNQPTGQETFAQQIQNEARKAQIERTLQGTDYSRSVSEKQLSAAQTARGEIIKKFNEAKPGNISAQNNFADQLKDIKSLEELRVKTGGQYTNILDDQQKILTGELGNLEQQIAAQEKLLTYAERRAAAQTEGKLFQFGIGEGMTDLQKETDAFGETIGKRIPSLFADNMASAMEGVIMQGKGLGDSLRSAATSFLNEITKAQIKNIAGQFTGGVGTLFKASGGPITGGSGNKDDVPAMLMGGEYVMNKKAVSKYGSGFMEALNNGSISGYARGGPVIRDRGLGSDVINASNVRNQTGKGGFQVPGYYGAGTISGKKNLLSFASQSYTSGAGDIIRAGSDSSYIDLTPESVRLTNFGRNQGPMAAAVKESKKEALGLYFQQLAAEKQAREEEKAQKKAFKRAIIGALITSAIGSVVGAGASGFKAGVAGAGKDAGFFGQLGAGFKGIFSGGNVGGDGTMVGGLRNLFSGNYQLSQISDLKGYQQYLNGNTQGTDKILAGSDITGQKGNIFNAFNNQGFDPTDAISYANRLTNGRVNDVQSIGVNNYSLFKEPDLPSANDKNYLFNTSVLPSRATGGRIPQTSGIDTVPAMLSGGEFIMNAGATQRIGASNLNAMNSGASTDTSSSAINDQLINKIDELIRVTKESSKPVTVNVSSQQAQTGGDNQQDGGSQKDQNLSKKIRDAVVQVLQEEKRLGGVLRRS
jgi:hypothetical protein